ncbi:MAG: ABC transporter permease [Sulfuritalea sp.]|jgi:ABC-type nitrate/sulfonate/bicarbonate transport system permease component|uniref:ABC transporter permease n=1 Tax=Sulfuritalea sp. TaxID=2480090 RepID=UPI001ACAA26A|nr:ABC transporter permease [Sulfuritalea sp.]MBN8473300.1 ABC transporter permease [Sulfuritalea sp.]MDK9714497.1 ABC transporter permease [Sulfuritalea sp.]
MEELDNITRAFANTGTSSVDAVHKSAGNSRPTVTLPLPPGVGAVMLARLRRLALPILLVAAWQIVSKLVLDDTTRALLPAPTVVAVAAWELVSSGELFRHLADSLRREFIAFSWSLVAIPVGVAMGWWKSVNEQLDSLVEILRPIPPLAWIPLSILWFGIGDIQNQFIIFLGIFFPILLNTITGVKGVDLNLVRAARCLGAGEGDVLRRVVLLAALPQIVTGIRIGLGVGWMALVAAELVGASSGLGFLINDARTLLRTDIVIVGMITIGLVGLVLDLLIREISHRLLPWSRSLHR